MMFHAGRGFYTLHLLPLLGSQDKKKIREWQKNTCSKALTIRWMASVPYSALMKTSSSSTLKIVKPATNRTGDFKTISVHTVSALFKNGIIYFNPVPLQLSDLSPSGHRIKEDYKRLTFPSHHLMDDHQHNNAILYSSVFSSSAQHRILPQGSLPPRA